MEPEGRKPHEPSRFSRRVFLRNSAGAGLFALTVKLDPSFGRQLDRGAALLLSEHHLSPHQVGATPSLELSVERPEDMALVDFSFYGFELDTSSKPKALVAVKQGDADIFVGVVAQLPPQAIGEGDYAWTSSGPDVDPTPVLSQLAGPTRLAFRFDKGGRIPLPTMTSADLLDWAGWTLNVQPTAQSGSRSQQIRQPEPFETAIEVPLALFLAPVTYSKGPDFSRFAARTEPLTYKAVTDCWTTTLVGRGTPLVSAVWASDYGESGLGATPQTNIVYGFYEAPPKIVREARPSRAG